MIPRPALAAPWRAAAAPQPPPPRREARRPPDAAPAGPRPPDPESPPPPRRPCPACGAPMGDGTAKFLDAFDPDGAMAEVQVFYCAACDRWGAEVPGVRIEWRAAHPDILPQLVGDIREAMRFRRFLDADAGDPILGGW